MLLLFVLLLGLFSGWVASMLLGRGARPGNWGELFVAGIAGSFLGGLVASLLSGDGLALRPSGLIGSILGAVVVLAAWGAIRGRSRHRAG